MVKLKKIVMNRLDFLKKLTFGGLVGGVGIACVDKIKKTNDNPISLQNSIDAPEELTFHILNDNEVFHPIHTDYKVNRSGEVSYINYRNKVRKATLSIHSTTGQYQYRLKDKVVNPCRFVFEAFTKTKLNQSYIVIPRDGNFENLCIDNLKCVRKKDYDKYSQFTLTKNAIRDKNGRVLRWV